MRPKLPVVQQWRDRSVLTAQHGAAAQDHQNSQKCGSTEKKRSRGHSSVQAMAGNCWHSVPSGIELDGCSASATAAWPAPTPTPGCGLRARCCGLESALALAIAVAAWLGGAAGGFVGPAGTGSSAACPSAMELTGIVRLWPCHWLSDWLSQDS